MTATNTRPATPAFGEYTPESSTIDARPILARNSSNIWEATEAIRSRLHAAVEAECRDRNVKALVLQSAPYVHPAWVKFESWIPSKDETLTRRSSMIITVTAAPYHLFTAIYTVALEWQGSTRVVDQIHTLSEKRVRDLVGRLTVPRDAGVFVSEIGDLAHGLESEQLRQKAYQLWKPVNKVAAFKWDWVKVAGSTLVIASILAFIVGTGAFADSATGVVLGAIVAFAAGVLLLRVVAVAPRLVRSPGKPVAEPRLMVNLDSWQTVVFGAGRDAAELNARMLLALRSGAQQRFQCTVERIWHWGLAGAEEREQVVLSYGRALVFAQIYLCGADLYVGWGAHMNLGQWTEKRLGAGVERATGERVDLMTVESNAQATTEYDLIDVNCLAEWTHAQITQALKHYLKERQIDQEIDFQIIRGERAALDDTQDEKKRQKQFLRKA